MMRPAPTEPGREMNEGDVAVCIERGPPQSSTRGAERTRGRAPDIAAAPATMQWRASSHAPAAHVKERGSQEQRSGATTTTTQTGTRSQVMETAQSLTRRDAAMR
jgi:hypothetical protein